MPSPAGFVYPCSSISWLSKRSPSRSHKWKQISQPLRIAQSVETGSSKQGIKTATTIRDWNSKGLKRKYVLNKNTVHVRFSKKLKRKKTEDRSAAWPLGCVVFIDLCIVRNTRYTWMDGWMFTLVHGRKPSLEIIYWPHIPPRSHWMQRFGLSDSSK